MRPLIALTPVLLLSIAAASPLESAVIELMDGSRISGAVVEQGDEEIVILAAGGVRHTISFDDILGADLSAGSDPALEKQALAERRRLAAERKRAAEGLLESLAAASPEERARVVKSLERFSGEVLLPALSRAVRSKHAAVREFALERLAGMSCTEAAVPLAVASLAVADPDYALKAHEAARAKNADLTRKVYELVTIKEDYEPELRVQAIQYLGAMKSRASVPHLIHAATVVTSDLRLTLVRSKGIREVAVSLGSLNRAATQVEIDLPEVELIQVQTSATVPVSLLRRVENQLFASLGAITGKEYGNDLAAWQAWWQEEKHATATGASESH